VGNGEADVHPWLWVEKILAYVDMVLLHCSPFVSSNRCESTRPVQWIPPPEGWIMINVDAVIFETKNCMGLGLVIRNDKGDFLTVVQQGFDKITNPEMAETITFRRAIQFALQLPHNKVLVTSDCLPLINKPQRQTVDRSHIWIKVEDIKKLRRAPSVVFSFIHVSRTCNQVSSCFGLIC
jgi:hypothetical protein